MDEHTYTDRELKRIIDRAVRMQDRGSPERTQGHDLDDLIAVGRELGIDPEVIRAAADEVVERRGSELGTGLAGGELVQIERATSDRPISRERAEELATDLRRITGLPGQGSVAGRHVSWQSSYLVSQQRAWTLSASIAPRGTGTRIEIESRNGMLAGALYGGVTGGIGIGVGVGVGVGVGLGALGSTLFAVVVPFATIGACYFLARSLFRAITRSRRRRLAQIVERVREIVDQDDPPPPGAGEPTGVG